MMPAILEFVHITQFFFVTLRNKLYITYIDIMIQEIKDN